MPGADSLEKHGPAQPAPPNPSKTRIAKIPPGGRTFALVVTVLMVVASLAYMYFYLTTRPSPQNVTKPVEGKHVDPLTKALSIVFVILATWLVYLLPSRALDSQAKAHPERKPDFVMIKGLIRSLMLFVAAFAIISILVGGLTVVWGFIGGFAGMFLGWSLQGPISGAVAWIIVTVKRPFRIGDRIFFPSWGLIGDVLDVGVMYTRLNQVGGTVGSEERSNREILIPNATLWGSVIINYTSQLAAGDEKSERFLLDEVVVRITFDSDWDEAERILLKAAREVTYDIIEETGVQPYIRSDLYDYGVYMRLRYMTLAVDRPRIVHEITKRIIKYIQESKKVDLAIPFVYSFRHGCR